MTPHETSPLRTGCGVVVAVSIVLCAVTGRADEKKKKDGLFDFETWKAPVTRERDAAKFLEPKGMDLSPAPSQSTDFRTVRLRIYADRDYRNVVLRWQSKIRAQIDRVNSIVRPVFNIRFEIESVRDWDRSHVGIPFDPLLRELEQLDPAREVDWVVGLVTPLHEVATSVHQIGGAHLASRHFVLRSMDDEQEIRALETEFKLLSVEERQKVYGDRKGHKGALTVAEDAVARAGRGEPDAWAITNEVESTRHRLALPRDAVRFGITPAQEPRFVAGFAETARLVASADPPAARVSLRDLAAAFPDAPGVDVLTCELGLKTKPVAAAAKRCEAALAKFKGATRAHYLLGVVAIRSRQEAVAEQHLRRAILLDPTEPSAWRTLGAMYRASGAASRLAQLENEHEALLSTPLPE